MRPLTIGQLSEITGAVLRGDTDCIIQGIAPLDRAQSGQLAFLHRSNFQHYLSDTQASVVILTPEACVDYQGNALITDNPLLAYAKAATALSEDTSRRTGVHPSAVIDPSAQIADSALIDANVVIGARTIVADQVSIGPNSVIGTDCMLGTGTRLQANVSLVGSVQLGVNCIIHSGAVLGSDGFGFVADQEGQGVKIPQLGGVRLGDQVEIGANVTIDCGALEDTVLANGVKIDNQVHIAHNVQIGEHTAIMGCVGIAGSAKIGRYCTVGGASNIVGHIELADHVHVSGVSVVTHSLTKPGRYTSTLPAMPHANWGKSVARIKQLDKIAKRLNIIEEKLNKNMV